MGCVAAFFMYATPSSAGVLGKRPGRVPYALALLPRRFSSHVSCAGPYSSCERWKLHATASDALWIVGGTRKQYWRDVEAPCTLTERATYSKSSSGKRTS